MDDSDYVLEKSIESYMHNKHLFPFLIFNIFILLKQPDGIELRSCWLAILNMVHQSMYGRLAAFMPVSFSSLVM